jgi:hypothetical protein
MSETDDTQKPTPPVPPTDVVEIRERRTSPQELSREFASLCECGGEVFEIEIDTGRTMLALWDATDFDSERFRLSREYEQTERVARCERCAMEVYL